MENDRERLRELTSGRPEMESLVNECLAVVDNCCSAAEVESARVSLLGKKGKIPGIFKGLSGLSTDDKRTVGRVGNELLKMVTGLLKEKGKSLSAATAGDTPKGRLPDVSLPGRMKRAGHKHLLTNVIEEVVSIFVGLGYRVETGPDVELDYYNFEALNQPPYHPARSLQDTLYVRREDPEKDNPGDILLRTHTSPVQVRVMESRKPPLFVISPGKAYRRDEIDATHTAVFHQVEGFAVDRGISMGHLKGTLEVFVRKLFGTTRDVRFRPHFFPFTEPSAEVDVSCFICEGRGCQLCKGVGWLEILGCGMIDPNVFTNIGYDPEEYTGFAFGMGIERIAMMKYGINDIRTLFDNDIRFLSQF